MGTWRVYWLPHNNQAEKYWWLKSSQTWCISKFSIAILTIQSWEIFHPGTSPIPNIKEWTLWRSHDQDMWVTLAASCSHPNNRHFDHVCLGILTKTLPGAQNCWFCFDHLVPKRLTAKSCGIWATKNLEHDFVNCKVIPFCLASWTSSGRILTWICFSRCAPIICAAEEWQQATSSFSQRGGEHSHCDRGNIGEGRWFWSPSWMPHF